MTADNRQPGQIPSEITTRFNTTARRELIRTEFGESIWSQPGELLYDPQDIKGRVALVTGASSGLGRATAFLLAEQGAMVAVAGQDDERTQATVSAIEARGGAAVPMFGDLRDREVAERIVRETAERFGRVDIGILNAGLIDDANPLTMTPEQWYKVAHGNLDISYFTAQALSNQMVAQNNEKPANVVLVSSVSMMGNADQPNYSAAKAGSEAMIKSFARSAGSNKILYGIIRPGFIDTEMIQRLEERQRRGMHTLAKASMPLKRMLTVEETANGIAYLATRKESGHILTLT